MANPLRDFSFSLFLLLPGALLAQAPEAGEMPAAERGSIIEDRAARKLLQAGDARLELGENEKALEVWESVVERYPQSQVRFEAHLRLADHLLKELRDPDKARLHYEAAAVEAHADDERRAFVGTLQKMLTNIRKHEI